MIQDELELKSRSFIVEITVVEELVSVWGSSTPTKAFKSLFLILII